MKLAVEKRRSYYALSNESPISDREIREIIDFAVLNVPSSFNSQSTRVVLLLGDSHKKLWQIVKDVLQKRISEEAFVATEKKIDGAFASGYGTVLFYEDEAVVEGLQQAFPSYKDNFPVWSHHTSAMHQFTIWTLLEEAGLGASLQHYNPIIDEEVAKAFNINPKWKLIAQMSFGKPIGEPNVKERQSLEGRVVVFE
ncbi:nitroreductase family protein [Dysgonomonas sp. Marseille-P4361]|uniref:nitroreductase family protein n=1 Tax=Dysgonomonas sp. Marseille-P4361 TaxID=2161820 RepID=UPI000D561727|nr:nitroreductase family protein [Dysgonomonas sp. Marseille-P4361]